MKPLLVSLLIAATAVGCDSKHATAQVGNFFSQPATRQ
jgi:hypothetical protein